MPFDEDEAPYPEDDPPDKRYHPGGRVMPNNRKEKYDEHSPQNERPAFGSLCHNKAHIPSRNPIPEPMSW